MTAPPPKHARQRAFRHRHGPQEICPPHILCHGSSPSKRAHSCIIDKYVNSSAIALIHISVKCLDASSLAHVKWSVGMR